MEHVSDHDITNFMDISHNKNGFVLPTVYPHYASCTVTEDMINEILRFNAIRTVDAFEITKFFYFNSRQTYARY